MDRIKLKSQNVVKLLIEKKLKITSAESCTGGLFSSYITSISGSSECFEGSFVTYSNEVKHKMIGVKAQGCLYAAPHATGPSGFAVSEHP